MRRSRRKISELDASLLAMAVRYRHRPDLVRKLVVKAESSWAIKIIGILAGGIKAKTNEEREAIKGLISWDTACRTIHAPQHKI